MLKRLLSLAAIAIMVISASAQHRPDYLYEEWRKSAYPSMDIAVSTNPTALLWRSEKHWEKKDVVYNVYLSQNQAFPEGKTIKSLGQRYCMFNPHQRLSEGKWYWKYEIVDGSKTTAQGPYSFVVPADAEGIITPTADGFMSNISKTHPRVMNYGRDLDQIRKDAPSHPLYKSIIRRASKIVSTNPYDGPVIDKNPAKQRKLNQIGGKEVQNYHALIEGYILSGDETMYNALMKRTEIFLTWPTDDLLGSKVLSALSTGYDVLYNQLSDDTKKKIEEIVDNQLKHGLKRWPGFTESRHVENHFWQMELAGNFTAAIVMLDHLDSAREMLEYTYELFIARFPNLATQDGGWAEGEGYYSVNKTAVVDMALLLKKVGKIDIFNMGWYKNLPDFFTYFNPIAAPVSGFGDMHDRVETGSLKGQSEMLMIGCEENNTYALNRLFNSMKPAKTFFGQPLEKNYWKKPLSEIEPWYQIVNNIRLKESDAVMTAELPKDKVFYGTGAAAMHTTVMEPQNDETVYFRSSPFGAKGHMHANQNAFNIARKGERIFYSTGYYTSFSNPHSLTSYRHTRAHNTILVDGMGQAFGHEGYGMILRHLEGETMSYVCGDASNAYRPVVDAQFSGFLKEHKITEGFGDAGVKTFKRHLFFARPGIVVIYDELEAEKPVEWSFLLHTLSPAKATGNASMEVNSERTTAVANVYGSTPIQGNYTDQYYSPAIDFKKKYPQGTPLTHHFTYNSKKKTNKMRFLSVIRLTDNGIKPVKLKENGKNKWKVGDITIQAEMDTNMPAQITVQSKSDMITATQQETVLKQSKGTTTCKDKTPEGNYAFQLK